MFEICEIKHKAEYNPLLISKQTPFTQAWFYGEWQEMMSRKVRRFEVKKDSEVIGFFQVIKYELPFSNNLLYIPHGPVFRLVRQSFSDGGSLGEGGAPLFQNFLNEFRKKLLTITKEENAIFARFDLYLPSSNPPTGGEGGLIINKYFHKVPFYAYNSVYFQPKYEWVLNIDKPESELLGNMHPKNRYNIHLAENKGVAIEIIENDFEKYFEDFYSLMKKTAKRNNFKLHPKVYYRNILKNCEENKNAFLILARYGDPSNKIGASKILAINLILLFGETAYFVFGGSSDEYKNLMSPHLSHWQGIIEAKNRGYKFYNFGGIGADGKHWEGISRFKKGFGGQLFEYSDSYDLVLKPFWYRLYNLRKWVSNQK